MRNALFPALLAGALAAGAAFDPAPAAAQPRSYFGPGPDGDYQPPAYDRDRAGLYGGPLYDREPYGYGYSGAGADRVRPDRSGIERGDRAQFERGYRMGREDERYRRRAQSAHAWALNNSPGFARGAADDHLADDDWDVADLLMAHSRQQRAMQDARQSLQEARTAMRQNDRARAEAALAQVDQKLRTAGPGAGGDRLAAGWVNQAELALERGDQEAARRAVRQARQSVGGPGEEAQQTQQGQRPAASSGSEGGGVRPQQGGGQQRDAPATGASGPPAR